MSQHSTRLRSPADFGLAVQQARLARGLSQTELAAELGLTQSAISEIENGKGTIYLRRLLTLARATGLEFAATWEEPDDAPRG
ncbi:helix-turn-helix domain-containing protein [Protaetiibacter intestinalis]|uniref:XRE family transcriptional regulator n=1 Tax=Protaetiibacter intestinalis TaxID=2419774 RepID=A0A387B4U6_9MICO|nr:helix-turn-helix transcriptional regulator [Protaetiibacter intestinalis]AYF98684.1 XRE family transcriptional regulator [Protaetiibacter intestinalis]